MPDLELDEIHRLLSVPAAAIARQRVAPPVPPGRPRRGHDRHRRPAWFDHLAAAATPVGADEGILIVIHLGGGNDGLNTVVPIGDATYRTLRGGLAITNPLPLSTTFGLHPALTELKARFDAGKVAIVHGVGQSTVNDLSHFSSTASWMAGTAGTSRSSGWLGRWLDGVPESEDGLRAVTVGSSVPLHLVGQKSLVTALDLGGDLFGADRSEPWMRLGVHRDHRVRVRADRQGRVGRPARRHRAPAPIALAERPATRSSPRPSPTTRWPRSSRSSPG